MTTQICIYDRVTLRNGCEGTVQFMGRMQNKKEIYYGITLDSQQGKNNGSYDGVKYFECSDNHGIFVTAEKIINAKSSQYNEKLQRVSIGDAVHVIPKKQTGILRFVGHVSSLDGFLYGVEFFDALANTNGSIDGRQYFDCMDYHGFFCHFDEIQLVPKMTPRDTQNALHQEQDEADPELHDLDPTQDDIYAPIATTFDSNEYDTAQTVIYDPEHDRKSTISTIHTNCSANTLKENQSTPYNGYTQNWFMPQSNHYPNYNRFTFNSAYTKSSSQTNLSSRSQTNFSSKSQTNFSSKPHANFSSQSQTNLISNPHTHFSLKSQTNVSSKSHRNLSCNANNKANASSGKQYWSTLETKAWNPPQSAQCVTNVYNANMQNNPYCDQNLNAAINEYSPKNNERFIQQHSPNAARDERLSAHNKCWQLGSQQHYEISNWAKHNFALELHKKGLFATKKQSVEDILSYTEFNKMKNPLHKTYLCNNEQVEKQCMQTWKNINSYIGVRKSRKPSFGHVHKLLLYALNGDDMLRNEIFCQLIKQTTKNPKINAVIKGWKLLLICCSFFPPSADFIGYLSCYLWSHTQYTNGIGPFAVKALHALDYVVINGARKHLPLPAEIEKIENLELE